MIKKNKTLLILLGIIFILVLTYTLVYKKSNNFKKLQEQKTLNSLKNPEIEEVVLEKTKGYDVVLLKNTTLKIKKGTLTRKGVTVIYNTNDDEYGNTHHKNMHIILEKEEDGKYYNVKPKITRARVLLHFEPKREKNKDYEYYISFEDYSKALPNGNYRIKYSYLEHNKLKRDNENHSVYAEFKIDDSVK